jgi:hypothetical protein
MSDSIYNLLKGKKVLVYTERYVRVMGILTHLELASYDGSGLTSHVVAIAVDKNNCIGEPSYCIIPVRNIDFIQGIN